MTTSAPLLLSDCRLGYRGFPGGPSARCRLRVYRSVDGGPDVAVVTELDDNPGPSVTTCAENVHAAVQAYLARRFRLVEHYPARSHRPVTYDRVEVRSNAASRSPSTVKWTHLGAEGIEAMIGEQP